MNGLTEVQRGSPPWHYVLLGEAQFYDWRSKNARLSELLDFARIRQIGDATA